MTAKKVSPSDELETLVRARYPLISIVSYEERRVLDSVLAVAKSLRRKLGIWTITAGLAGLKGIEAAQYTDPVSVLRLLAEQTPEWADPTMVVLLDVHNVLTGAVEVRSLRDIASALSGTRHTVITLSPTFKIPADLSKTIAQMTWPLPDAEELKRILAGVEADLDTDKYPVTLNGGRERLVRAMLGLTAWEAENALLAATVAANGLGEAAIGAVLREKAAVVKKSGVLEFYDTEGLSMASVGGLHTLKAYAAEAMLTLISEQAAAAGVEAARGILMVGVPGTGKSLIAKAMAAGKMPILRFDVGSLMGSLVGESEANMRNAMQVAEAVSPAIVWLDEVEKALAGAEDSARSDGGVKAGIFGQLLTWMQETKAPLYFVATANEVRGLRPEFLQRFDDLFFVDLPGQGDRAEIVRVLLAERGLAVSNDDVESIATETHGYSGREIAKVVKAGVRKAFTLGVKPNAIHILAAAGGYIPTSVTMEESLSGLRQWATGRAILAGEALEPQTRLTGRGRRVAELD